MKKRKRVLLGLVAGCTMLILILDTKTAIQSAQVGVELCLKTVIPSLYPFFILSGIINSCLLGQKISLLRSLGKLCKIPKGGESLLLVGFLAGYPVGAQLITQAYKSNRISEATAKRMLGFCNNAGPAFLFGMLSPLFTNNLIPWVIWGVHITSALIVGCLLPKNKELTCTIEPTHPIGLPKSLQLATKSMVSVCGWIVTFRVIIGFCDRWFLWLFPEEMQVLFMGFLELSNGIIMLNYLPAEGLRFVLSSAMLAFGGLCVGMQTISVTEKLGVEYYFPGKVCQCLLSIVFSLLLQPILFRHDEVISLSVLPMVVFISFTGLFLLLLRKKSCSIYRKNVV